MGAVGLLNYADNAPYEINAVGLSSGDEEAAKWQFMETPGRAGGFGGVVVLDLKLNKNNNVQCSPYLNCTDPTIFYDFYKI